MLEVKNLSVRYGQHLALNDISIQIDKGEVVVILGANGAGKSSLLRSIAGLSEGNCDGEISFFGKSIISCSPNEIVSGGIALVPEGRAIFGDLNVEENLRLGAYTQRARINEQLNLDQILTLFPKLRERRKQITRTMSGGEQQMVAIGRALMSDPAILMLDEPSLGLSPLLSKELFQVLGQIRDTGPGVLVVEQNARLSLAIADRGYLIENGQIVGENDAATLSTDSAVQTAYLGRGDEHQKDETVTPISSPEMSHLAKPHKNFLTPGERHISAASTQELIGENLEDLLDRASTSAKIRSGNIVSFQKMKINGKMDGLGPGVLDVTSQFTPTGSSSELHQQSQFDSGDQRISKMLFEFEEVAARAKKSPRRIKNQTDDDLQNISGGTKDPTPKIPVFRKSRVKIFKRVKGGALVETKEV